MPTELERQLIGLKLGDHICLIYETMAEQMASALPFMKEGLARGERCVYVADDRTVATIAQALVAAGVDVTREDQRQALSMLTKQDSYLRGGRFDPHTMIDFLRTAQTQALADGFSGLRGTGEMTWALGPEAGCERLIEYEALLNDLLANSRSVFLCQYNRARFDPVVIHDILRTHPIVIIGDLVCPNPYYEPPDLVLSPEPQPTTEYKQKRVGWWIAQLKRARAAEQDREQVLEQLKLSERRLAEAQQAAHIGSWERDLRTNEVTWSDELYRLFDMQPHDFPITYQSFLDRVSPQDADRIRGMLDEAVGERRSFSCDYRIVIRDGSVRVLHEQGSVILNEAGEPIRLVGTAQDVTERKRVVEMLEENRRRYVAVFENALDPLVLFDDRCRYVDCNPAACAVLGYSREEFLRLSLWDITQVEDHPRVQQWLKGLLAEGPQRGEVKLVCKDGTLRDIEYHSVANILPGVHLCAHRDLTEQKRTEAALRQYAERLQALSRRLLEVQEEERRHLARELHDEFGQSLATIALHLHAARGLAGEAARPRLDECMTLLQQAGEQVRNLVLELRPTILDTLGLEAALHWLAEQHRQRTGCEVQVVGHLSGAQLSPNLATACFRVVQEALTNVVRHASARQVWIEVNQSESVLELVVRDDGVGFDVAATQEQAAKRGCFGLLGMAERVQLLGCTLRVESEPGKGTRIRATFPLSDHLADPEE